MKRRYIYVLIVFVCAGLLLYNETMQGDEAPQEITVFAAASLTAAVSEIAENFEKQEEGQTMINCSFAGSGTLKSQIEEGAPCDLFISAAKADMDQLEEGGLVDKTARINLLGNTLTLIASKEKKKLVSLETLGGEEVKTIAVGTPETVPAGRYAMEAMETLGIKAHIEEKFVLAKDVKSVMDYVETGNADCGFVYKTDAMLLKSGAMVETLPEETHEPIVYPMALMKSQGGEESEERKEQVRAFYEYLQGESAQAIFEKYGFTVL